MAEAEDVITDAARHATVFARDLWRRHRPPPSDTRRHALRDSVPRLDLLLAAVVGRTVAIRVAPTPAPPTALRRLFDASARGLPRPRAVPATDGVSILLPPLVEADDAASAHQRFRLMALRQAARLMRGSGTHVVDACATALIGAAYLLSETVAADAALARALPGIRASLLASRRSAAAQRPPAARRAGDGALESLYLRWLEGDDAVIPASATPQDSLAWARRIAAERADEGPTRGLLADEVLGQLLPPIVPVVASRPDRGEGAADQERSDASTRGARMQRRPQARAATEDEDDERQGAWMVQADQPHEVAEDPHGLQRPTDRDESQAAEEYAESLSDLPEARLVATPQRAREILLSDEALDLERAHSKGAEARADAARAYPEWDWRTRTYRLPGALVHLQPAVAGDPRWVGATLHEHAARLDRIRQHFELLRASRVRSRRQLDGEEIDLEAAVESYADFRAGLPRSGAVYQHWRTARRDLAIALLIDVSGSTDAWVSASARIIDVEKEALLLVCHALEALAEPYCVLSFSGEGATNVVVRELKGFDERYSAVVAQRIAGLEPERYTRAGAALRHATAELMRIPARHRLLLVLSDGKPNDADEYDGRYGIEDVRQAVTEARLQGVFPFCLTVDRQAAAYLPQLFGEHHYALLPQTARLPNLLLDWLRRLVAGSA